MQTKTESLPPKVIVGVAATLAKTYTWFATVCRRARSDAESRERQKQRTLGPQLSPQKLLESCDALIRLSSQIAPLEDRRKELVVALRAHWGHTGVTKIDCESGTVQIVPQIAFGVDEDAMQKSLARPLWLAVTKRRLDAALLLARASTGAANDLKILIAAALETNVVRVSVRSSKGESAPATLDEEEVVS